MIHVIYISLTLAGFNKNGMDLLLSAAITIELPLVETGAAINAMEDPIKKAAAKIADNLQRITAITH